MPGGVCAVLDYEVELMVDYVSEMTTRLVMPQRRVNPAFRKFVSQVLTSTRLPSTTILLGMNYLAKRINMMGAAGENNHDEGQTWRMLTIALLLASKFLDDQTFQNKSWSDVCGLPVQELNALEEDWLCAIRWSLYVNLDASEDYQAWLSNWKEWLETKKRDLLLMGPIEPNGVRTPALQQILTDFKEEYLSLWHQRQATEDARFFLMKSSLPNMTSRRLDDQESIVHFRLEGDPWRYPLPFTETAPLTPPDSGSGTPDYTNSSTLALNYGKWIDRALLGPKATTANYQPPPPYSSFLASGHGSSNAVGYGHYNSYGPTMFENQIPGPFYDLHDLHRRHTYFDFANYHAFPTLVR